MTGGDTRPKYTIRRSIVLPGGTVEWFVVSRHTSLAVAKREMVKWTRRSVHRNIRCGVYNKSSWFQIFDLDGNPVEYEDNHE